MTAARANTGSSGILNALHLDSGRRHNKIFNELKGYRKQKNGKQHGKEVKNGEKKEEKGKDHGERHHGYQYHHEVAIEDVPNSDTQLNHGRTSSTAHRSLRPVGQNVSSRASLAQRRTDSRLRGADLYVARLGWKPKETTMPSKPVTVQELDSLSSSMSSLSTTGSFSLSTGSLHEELSCPYPTPTPSSPTTIDAAPIPSAVSSHPCYRCVSYMHAAGIRRVFWTNADGEWESGKVRDLMDLLEEGGDDTTGLYVSKHEVLMLRRGMGGG
jgi:hypothetical protein